MEIHALGLTATRLESEARMLLGRLGEVYWRCVWLQVVSHAEKRPPRTRSQVGREDGLENAGTLFLTQFDRVDWSATQSATDYRSAICAKVSDPIYLAECPENISAPIVFEKTHRRGVLVSGFATSHGEQRHRPHRDANPQETLDQWVHQRDEERDVAV